MEDTLGDVSVSLSLDKPVVLILVLMEDTLGELRKTVSTLKALPCLNPCSNGRYSRRYACDVINEFDESLNPCSNGRYSRRVLRGIKIKARI